jgi:hypothetical protein
MAAHKVHDWIYEQLQVTDGRVTAVQIDPIKRQIFIKFDDPNYAQLIVQRTNGSVNYKHSTGEITTVQVDIVVPIRHPDPVRCAEICPAY